LAKKSGNNPTMHEVAQEAGVSIATVSRVINGNRPVGKDLEKRVLRAMKKLHYHPSSLARSLKMQESMLVGILIPILEHPAYSRMASSVEKSLFNNGYRGIVCNSEEDENRENAYIEMLLRQRADGIIVNTSARNPEYLHELNQNNIPIVLFDRSVDGVSCHQVFCDNSQGGYSAIQHLAELGHQRVGVIAAPTYPEVIQRRLKGVKHAIADYQLDNNPLLIRTGDNQLFDMGYESARELLSMDHRPTAIFALTDVTAVGVLHAAREMGIRVPTELSVMGYDDVPIANYMLPPLTTIAQPFVQMGQTAVELLLKSIENPDTEPERAVLPTHMVIRESAAPPNQ